MQCAWLRSYKKELQETFHQPLFELLFMSLLTGTGSSHEYLGFDIYKDRNYIRSILYLKYTNNLWCVSKLGHFGD